MGMLSRNCLASDPQAQVAAPSTDLGANARAELIQHHLDLWNQFNSTGGAPYVFQIDKTTGAVTNTYTGLSGSNGRGVVVVGNTMYYTSATHDFSEHDG